MKTIFKIGMEVYDQIAFPNKKGVVTEIGEGTFYPLVVRIEDFYLYYKLNGAFGSNVIPTLSTKPYKLEMQGFEQKVNIPTFECVWDNKKEVYTSPYYDENYSGYPSEELADAAEALRKLLFLRDYYNEDWQPNWEESNEEMKFCIEIYKNDFYEMEYFTTFRVMAFKSKGIRNRFLKEQKELLEIAKPLL